MYDVTVLSDLFIGYTWQRVVCGYSITTSVLFLLPLLVWVLLVLASGCAIEIAVCKLADRCIHRHLYMRACVMLLECRIFMHVLLCMMSLVIDMFWHILDIHAYVFKCALESSV